MFNYISRHLQVFFSTLGELFRSPMNTLLNATVIGITLAIPTLAYVSVNSAKTLTNAWEVQPQVNLYLEDDYKESDISAMIEEIGFIEGVSSTRLIPKAEALKQFKASSGLADELDSLKVNPLPNTLIVTPKTEHSGESEVTTLVENLLKIDGIKEHSVNMDWLSRFNSLLAFGRSLFLILAALLSIAVLLVINNTVGLLIRERKQEIIVTQLVGGTNSFIKRPFLYYGALLGLIGSLIAILIYVVAHFLLQQPIEELAKTYNSQFTLASLSIKEIGILCFTGLILGWLASQFAVIRQLHKIKPK